MNYIRLLNAAFERLYFDDRPNPTHVSLYMALFHEWNANRFADGFFVSRRELMRAAKIGSKSTYHRCIVDLDSWGYLSYLPSNNPYKGSSVKMANFCQEVPESGHYSPMLEQLAEQYRPRGVPITGHHRPNDGHDVYPHRPTSGQALVSNINNTKQVNINKRPKDCRAVIDFFEKKGFGADEAKKFHGYYTDRLWQTGDGQPVRDWQALAISWMEHSTSTAAENGTKPKQVSQKEDHLRTSKTKDYGQPL
ncbi:hypothetical protein BWZ22_04060 [Seonamhaeicola sp. S2-3]|uniref:hypothetical protein n=1 Tax=Seonamhaeicola sp. S2-3 TaxID=1936081 RepID=UPI0009728A44|nr:hypothetical protein [Seonamhaeicola sp. S2-3]APY10464.1 hypothetical protein BWZ22_04060 [Seonamhaeicola sp. S2-3]